MRAVATCNGTTLPDFNYLPGGRHGFSPSFVEARLEDSNATGTPSEDHQSDVYAAAAPFL